MADSTTATTLRSVAATLLAEATRLDAMAVAAVPIPIPADAPVNPAPPPASTLSLPPAKIFQLLDSDTSKWLLGKPVKVMARVSGYAKLTVVECGGAPPWPWLVQRKPQDAVPDATGLVAIDYTPSEVGGFIKVWPDAELSLARDSSKVPQSAAPIVAVAPAPQPIAAPGPVSDWQKRAIAYRNLSCFNVNIEREKFATTLAVKDSDVAYLRDCGVGGVRAFNPFKLTGVTVDGKQAPFWDYKLGVLPTKAEFARFFPGLHKLVDAKMQVQFDFMDIQEPADVTGDNLKRLEDWIDLASQWFAAEAFDPLYIVPGAVNEWAGETNQLYDKPRESLYRIMRGRLPRHLLGMAPCYWGSPRAYTDEFGAFRPVADDGAIFFFHAYDRQSAKQWADWAVKLKAWSAANGGRQVMCGELGPGNIYDGRDYNAGDSWVGSMGYQNPALADFVPNLWAITQGDWTMNRGFNDLRFWDGSKGWDPKIEQAVKAASAANRAARKL